MTKANPAARSPLPGGPASLSQHAWAGRLGSLIQRYGLGESDPAVRQARTALAYWRIKDILDAHPDDGADALAEVLRDACRARPFDEVAQ